LSFPSGNAIKRIKAGVKALFADSSCQDSFCQPAPSPSGQVSFQTKKEYRFILLPANPSLRTLAGLKRPSAGRFHISRAARFDPFELPLGTNPFADASWAVASF
jgi:hypothetical protein